MFRLPSASQALYDLVGRSADALATVQTVREDLRYQLIVAVAVTDVMAVLSVTLRRPYRLARVTALAVAVPLAIAWSCGVAQSTETLTQRSLPYTGPEQAAFAALLPPWYATVTSVAAFAVLALLAAAPIALLRTSASDFYLSNNKGGEPGLYSFARRSG
jgi:hypothetical protein